MILIIGSISFLEQGDDEITDYTNKDRLAIVHSIISTIDCDDEEIAGELGEESLTMGYDSYLIPVCYEVNGDIHYECENNNLPITPEDFRRDYLVG